MADTYEKDLAQKSSLTTSDYIRVVGSDNVSYKQSVSAVKTALGVDALTTAMGTFKLLRKTANATSFTFAVANADRFRYFLLIGGTSASAPFVYHGFMNTDNSVALNKIIDPASRTISATYDGTTLTISSTTTLYGGVRILYLD